MKMGQLEKFIVNSASHSRRVSRHAEKMLQFAAVRPGQSYLDVGCGNGAAAIQIAKKLGLDVTGVDVDPDQIQAAKDAAGDLPNVQFLTADATRLPFNDREFAVVTTNKVTHHLPNWEIAVEEMIRVLRPNGYLVYGDLLFPVGWLPVAVAC
jgi:ubiquinone/menaquinone biosynthesis C-methylase UbiE